MGSTFKTDLDNNNTNRKQQNNNNDNCSNNSKEIQEGFFNLKNFQASNRMQSQTPSNFTKTISPNNNFWNTNAKTNCQEPGETKKGIGKGFFNMANLSKEKNDGIKNFNTKGITFQNNNIESHLNIVVDNLSIKNVDDYLTSKEKTQENSNLIFKELFEIDNQMVMMKNNMSNMRRNEMNRLIKEFNMNDYERRFKTTRYNVISALIGEENTNMEINRQNRENNVKYFFVFFYLFCYRLLQKD